MLPIKCVCFLVTWICLHTIMLSKVTKHILYGRKIHLIRDDLLNVNGISGNKIRKLAYFMNDPHSIPDTTNTVVSFGGCQSNAMVAISQLVNNLNSIRNNKLQFIYFTKYLSPSVMSNPIGNLKDALDLGMQIIPIGSEAYKSCERDSKLPLHLLPTNINTNEGSTCVWIPQGVLMKEAKVGVCQLMDEVVAYIKEEDLKGNKLPWKICFASGTGTMALFASQHIHQYLSPSSSSSLSSSCPSYSHSHIEVIALPCLSTEVDLKESMTKLDNISDKKRIFPTILTDHLSYKERQFAYPYPEHLSIFQSLRTQLNVDFDMIYAPRAMEILIHNKCLNKYLNNTTTSCHSSTIDNSRSSVDNSVMSRQRDEEEEEFNLMYYHCGGVEGNMSQLERYKAKGLL